MKPEPLLFTLGATRALGERVATRLGVALAAREEREFEDGEHKSRPLVNVRGRHAVVMHSLYSDPEQSVDGKLLRLLFFLGCLRDAAATEITALVPYLAFARKDRKTQSRDPVTTRYVAALLEAVGTDRVVCMDVHNLAAFQNAFRCRTEHLEAAGLFVRHFSSLPAGTAGLSIVSPDAGGMKRAEQFRGMLSAELGVELPLAFLEKARGGGALTVGRLVGDVSGCAAIIVDDLISTGRTLVGAARACKEGGANAVYAAATHGVFASDANLVLTDSALDGIVVTDTVPALKLTAASVLEKLTVLDTSELIASAITRRRLIGGVTESTISVTVSQSMPVRPTNGRPGSPSG